MLSYDKLSLRTTIQPPGRSSTLEWAMPGPGPTGWPIPATHTSRTLPLMPNGADGTPDESAQGFSQSRQRPNGMGYSIFGIVRAYLCSSAGCLMRHVVCRSYCRLSLIIR